MLDINIMDNSGAVLSTLEEKVKAALEACGMTAETYAKRDCPVDTGRLQLRNSITYAIKGGQSDANTSGGQVADPEEYEKKAEPEKNTVYLGTNVKYGQPCK